jgi:hypothetical protein
MTVTHQPLDELLLGTPRHPLLIADGYDWISSIEADHGVPLLFAELQRIAPLFERGGYIEDYDALVAKGYDDVKYRRLDDKPVFDDAVKITLSGMPYLSWLGRVSPLKGVDLGLVLSVYGKVCSKLPEEYKARVFPADVQGGFSVEMGRQPSVFKRVRDAILPSKSKDELTLYDVAQAAVDTVECYVASIAAGELLMTEQRAKDIVGSLRTLEWLIEEDYPLECYEDEPHNSLERVSRELADAVGLDLGQRAGNAA